MMLRSAGAPGPAITADVLADHFGRNPRDYTAIGHCPAYHRTGRDHHIPADYGARQDDHPGTQPASGTDRNGRVGWPLAADGQVGVGVTVVLVGDVHIRAGVDVIADRDRVVGDDMAAPADDTPVTDPQQRHLAQVLPRDHARAQADLGPDHRPGPDLDPPLAVQGAGGEADDRPRAERGERPARRGVGGDRPGALRRPPQAVHSTPGHPAAAGVECASRRHDGEGYRSVAASWPQAAAISRPRVSRTVQATPAAATLRTNSCSAGLGEASHLLPGVGFSGIAFTCTSGPRAWCSTRPSRSARHGWSFTSRIRAYSTDTRRPVRSAWNRAAASTSATFHRVFTGTSSSRSSSSGACSDTASVTARPSLASRRIAGTSPTVDTVTERWEMPKPSGTGSQIRRTASSVRR